MKSGEHVLQQVSYHSVLLILTPTVVCVEVDVLLSEPMYFKEMVEHADDGVRPFTYVEGFINKVIHLTWYSLAAYSKDCTWDPAGGGHWGRTPAGPSSGC